MKITSNSAYDQSETLNFTSAGQAVIVYTVDILIQLPRNRYAERHIVLSYAMQTADESNHSAAGTLHPHRSIL